MVIFVTVLKKLVFKMNEKDFLDKLIGRGVVLKVHIAKLYFPALEDKSALNALSRAINGDKLLREELERETSYNKWKHSFTPRQVEIIVKHIGPPISML